MKIRSNSRLHHGKAEGERFMRFINMEQILHCAEKGNLFSNFRWTGGR